MCDLCVRVRACVHACVRTRAGALVCVCVGVRACVWVSLNFVFSRFWELRLTGNTVEPVGFDSLGVFRCTKLSKNTVTTSAKRTQLPNPFE